MWKKTLKKHQKTSNPKPGNLQSIVSAFFDPFFSVSSPVLLEAIFVNW